MRETICSAVVYWMCVVLSAVGLMGGAGCDGYGGHGVDDDYRSTSEPTDRVSGFFLSKTELQANYRKELAASLESTVSQIPGIVQARVHMNISDPVDAQSDSAAVVLWSHQEVPVSDAELRQLFHNAAGISPSRISVHIYAQESVHPPDDSAGISESRKIVIGVVVGVVLVVGIACILVGLYFSRIRRLLEAIHKE